MSVITTYLEHAIHELQAGSPVAIPTETVYGLAALIDKPEAIQAVFTMKNRPLNHPLIVHVAEDWDLTELVQEIPAYAQQLINAFWPGPLTLVFRSKKNQINPLITGDQPTVAIRCPAHPLAQKLLKQLNTPVVAPSANPFGKVSPTTALHVKESFEEQELLILDGGRCTIGIESTIIDVTNPHSYQILRHGLINESAIAQVIATLLLKNENTIRVPGKLDCHYQPHKKLYYFDSYETLSAFCHNRNSSVYVIASQKPESISEHYFHFQGKSPEQAAFDLYYQFRKADTSTAQYIAIELPPETSAWYGIRERILKAGHPYVAK